MFYRIDYDRLNQFAGALCEQIAFRGVEGDRIEVMTIESNDQRDRRRRYEFAKRSLKELQVGSS